jgi:hypothetical protein
MVFTTRICGIPCQVRINNFSAADHNASSSADFYGGFEFDVLDARGRRADWLERKMTWDDEQQLMHEIETQYFELY